LASTGRTRDAASARLACEAAATAAIDFKKHRRERWNECGIDFLSRAYGPWQLFLAKNVPWCGLERGLLFRRDLVLSLIAEERGLNSVGLLSREFALVEFVLLWSWNEIQEARTENCSDGDVLQRWKDG
jgi:hypothetical protein